MAMHCFIAVVKNQSTIVIEVITTETNFLYATNIKTVFTHNLSWTEL
jgi:hypothetical protein